jgi:flagellar assembly factor FliW
MRYANKKKITAVDAEAIKSLLRVLSLSTQNPKTPRLIIVAPPFFFQNFESNFLSKIKERIETEVHYLVMNIIIILPPLTFIFNIF